MYVKLCGLRTDADVAAAVDAGASAVGFVFGESVRQVDLDTARRLVAQVPSHVLTVGVFAKMTADRVRQLATASGIGAIQLHGDYPRAAFEALSDLPATLIRATALTAETDVRVGAYGEEMLLLDSPVAGSGHQWDLGRLDAARPEGRWLLAGGLSPRNVGAAIERARPWGVDVSSGVESRRGVKDHGLMREFVAAAREAAERLAHQSSGVPVSG
ncbi:phosphoribosylanthranilate isomerase [Streptoalloteichus tenebrarius]|uniref:N-(5'-phosphoribosyl)anthranilate isomerase n=1 Tax=Streptoalloteichus tenebrarius (strain ATCC 17920 / DSM 40477 / JCM 4838 / CBS 697.72 / NBRC 16177 / NCIMB 11028 / NRRL B-12390 / A12253. 1 / ISP 5477) TaxID=1933 RepID=A0ABT1HNX5_STRSD|nr:phosphoribosylanthranilate isomerase [Streptoalloteichus tenebrarius]MCP2257215.1 phosphoribosylanthranilate isomerase [Streptoalloteichus tenebrarius]